MVLVLDYAPEHALQAALDAQVVRDVAATAEVDVRLRVLGLVFQPATDARDAVDVDLDAVQLAILDVVLLV